MQFAIKFLSKYKWQFFLTVFFFFSYKHCYNPDKMDNKPDTYVSEINKEKNSMEFIHSFFSPFHQDLSLNLNKAQSPDSGIDMSKFNIVDFILDDGCDWDTNMTVVEPTGINAITTVTAPQGSPSVSTSPSGPENAEAETIS